MSEAEEATTYLRPLPELISPFRLFRGLFCIYTQETSEVNNAWWSKRENP